jgi:Spy/CpxP family protein refolding chaperone
MRTVLIAGLIWITSASAVSAALSEPAPRAPAASQWHALRKAHLRLRRDIESVHQVLRQRLAELARAPGPLNLQAVLDARARASAAIALKRQAFRHELLRFYQSLDPTQRTAFSQWLKRRLRRGGRAGIMRGE